MGIIGRTVATTLEEHMKIEIELNEREARSLEELAAAQTDGDLIAMATLLVTSQVTGICFDQEIWGTKPERTP
jgi:hypothetical protein